MRNLAILHLLANQMPSVAEFESLQKEIKFKILELDKPLYLRVAVDRPVVNEKGEQLFDSDNDPIEESVSTIDGTFLKVEGRLKVRVVKTSTIEDDSDIISETFDLTAGIDQIDQLVTEFLNIAISWL